MKTVKRVLGRAATEVAAHPFLSTLALCLLGLPAEAAIGVMFGSVLVAGWAEVTR
jgi:hypothetical protein